MSRSKKPKDNPLMISLLKAFWPVSMQLKFGPVEIKVIENGIEKLKDLRGKRVILCPNHPSTLDADVIFALSEMLKEEFNYLAAHVLFYGHRGLNSFLLQHMGCYPVVRGSPDFDAFRTSKNVLLKAKRKLVIFPEGEVSHDNDTLMTLEPGAVQIAFSVLSEMEKTKAHVEPILLVPMAIRYFYRTDISKALNRSIKQLQDALRLEIDGSISQARQLRFIAEAVLLRLEAQFGSTVQTGESLAERIANVRVKILQTLADKLGVRLPESDPHLDWVHLLQKALTLFSEGRLDLPSPLSITKHEFIRSANKDISHVLNFVSLDRTLPAEDSSQEALAEIIEVLELEVFGHAYNKGSRVVILKVGEPINLLEYFDDYKKHKQQTIRRCKSTLSSRLSEMLAEIEDNYRPQLNY